MTGFRATVAVRDPAACPVADASDRAGGRVRSVTRASRPTGETVLEEVSIPREEATGRDGNELAERIGGERVYEDDRTAVYRFEREPTGDCACDVVEDAGVPVASIRVEDGALLLSVRARDLDSLVTVVDALRDRFDEVLVEAVSQAEEAPSDDMAIVDRSRLTDRQREILRTAHEMGYFEYPKGANATDVAEELGVARSTFSEHLAAAQTKVLGDVFEP